MTLLKAALIFGSISILQACVSVDFHIAGEAKCRSIEGDDLCPKLSHLETGVTAALDENWQAKLSYDFAQSRKSTWYDSLDTFHLDLPPEKSWLADYGLRYEIDDRLSLAVEDVDGTTSLHDASHLAFSRNLQDIAWKQTALRLRYDHEKVFESEIQLGLGEGERLKSDDDDIYWGAKARWYLKRALAFETSYSEDKSSLNKDALFWSPLNSNEAKDVRNERFASSLILTGLWPMARGLEASVGWQSTRLRKTGRQTMTIAPTHLALDPTESLTETLGGQGQTRRETLYYSLSYRILAEYILAFHGSHYRSKFGEDVLVSCQTLDAQGSCVGSTDKYRSFLVKEFTYGLGKIDEDGWSVLLEAHEERYDRLYQNFHFLNGRNPRQKNMRLVQARIAWNW